MNEEQRTGVYAGVAGLLFLFAFVIPSASSTTPEEFNDQGQPLMSLRSVSGWSQFGGAFLFSSRSDRFRTSEGQRDAADVLERNQIEALITIGGDGTFNGAMELAKHWGGQIVGCPGTIDNDLIGTDYTIGFSTAVQTAVEAVDKIRDTAHSHELFISCPCAYNSELPNRDSAGMSKVLPFRLYFFAQIDASQ